MLKQLTDLDLISAFDQKMETTLHDSYYQALSMLRVTPSYSLIDFRKILETICLSLANKKLLNFSNDKLSHHITELHQAQVIDKELHDICRQLNTLCNSGRHTRNTPNDDKTTVHLETNAIEARKFLVEIIQHLLAIEFNDLSFRQIKLADNPSQERKELLYQALENKQPSDYYKVGQFYQNLAYDTLANDINVQTQALANSYFKIAGQHYELACRLSADKAQSVGDELPLLTKVAQTCNTKPLVALIQLMMEENVCENSNRLTLDLLQIAAKQHCHPWAQAQLGFDFYDNKKYHKAEKFWLKSAKQNCPLAFKGLFILHHKGEAKQIDNKKALHYLKQGVTLDCIQCQAELGNLMCIGELVERNMDEGRRLIKKAVQLGCVDAFTYFVITEAAYQMAALGLNPKDFR